MALSSATLSTELQAIAPTLATANTGLGLATAYGNYMKGAVAATPIIQAAIPSAVTAMAGVMAFTVGMTALQGANQIRGGLGVFWFTMGTAAASFFAGAVSISPPPGIDATLDPLLAAAFTANTADGTTAQQAGNAVAAVLHTASLGAFVTTPGPTATPIT